MDYRYQNPYAPLYAGTPASSQPLTPAGWGWLEDLAKQVVEETVKKTVEDPSWVKSLWPFAAGPSYVPSAPAPATSQPLTPAGWGWLEDLAKKVVEETVKKTVEDPSWVKSLWPFAAGPSYVPSAPAPASSQPLTPAGWGWLEDLAKKVVEETVKKTVEDPSWVKSLWPFAVGPSYLPPSQDLQTAGIFGGALGSFLGGLVGGQVGGGTGADIGKVAGGFLGGLLPFSVTGMKPTNGGQQQGSPQSILLPQSAIPPTVRTDWSFMSDAMKGAADAVILRGLDYLQNNPDSVPKAREEIAELFTRAVEFYAAGDYQHAITQAYVANYALDMAVAQATQEE